MGKGKKTYKIWCSYDTETSNTLDADAEYRAWPILYIFDDLHNCDMATYEPDCADEQITFYRTYQDAVAYVVRMIEDAKGQGVVPIMCTYNMIFDLQSIMYELHKLYDMEVNAQSSTNVYTLDLYEGKRHVLRVWDTFHLDPRNLDAMGDTCGVAKLKGDWDYDLVRTPETPLSDMELGYAARDVQVIPAYLRWLCDAHDWLTPDMLGCRVLTKTSIVRQMARKRIGNLKVRTTKGNKITLLRAFESLCRREQSKDFDTFALRLACFRGGLTFTAALTASHVVRNVYSLDETSAHHAFINGRRCPIDFHPLDADTMKLWLDDAASYTLQDVLNRYAYPFQRWFHVRVRVHNLRLRKGSAFDTWGIGLLAQAKFGKYVPQSKISDSNMRAIDAMELIREQGYIDTASSPIYAFGKLMADSDTCLCLTELEWWCVCQVYEFDSYEPIAGEGTTRSIWPPDYVALQSNMLFEQKNDAKIINAGYESLTPYDGIIGASVPQSIAQGFREGKYTDQFCAAWYQIAVKGAFNSIYGTQAQNLFKAEYEVKADSELGIDRDTRPTEQNFSEKLDEQKHPMVLYTYGMRIVGGSRMQIVIACILLFQAFGAAVTVTGGDTDSLKVSCPDFITPDMLLDALEPLHRATTDAINLCMARLRRNFPEYASTLDHVGCFELEPAIKGAKDAHECAYAYHLEAWNKARISIDARGHAHITCAGLSRPDGMYHIGIWIDGMLSRGFAPDVLLPYVLGYNTTITNDVCHALDHHKPAFGEMVHRTVTDYLGNSCTIDAYQAIALFPTNRRIGDLMKTANADNVAYLQDKYGRTPDTTERVIGVEYNYAYAYALVLMGTFPINVCRHFVDNFARPVLYEQDYLGMREVEP